MTARWYSNGEEWIRLAGSYVSPAGTGFLRVDREWEQTGADGDSDWIAHWERPSTPPPAPTLSVSLVTKTRNRFAVTLTTPTGVDGSMSRVVVKVGIGTAPNPPSVDTSGYYTESNTNEPWSEWFTDQAGDIVEGETRKKNFPSVTQSRIDIPLNTNVTFSAWVRDEFGNWSEVATQTVATLKATDIPYGGVEYTTVIMPYMFDEYASSVGLWQYRGTSIAGTTKYSDPTWIRSTANPAWFAHTGGSFKRMTYLYFAGTLHKVLNQAASVTSVEITMKRRWNTDVNKTGGTRVNDAGTFGRHTGAKFRVWASPTLVRPPTGGGGSDLISGSDSEVNTGYFSPGTTKTFLIPARTWEKFLAAKSGTARSLVFYDPNSTGTSTDPWSISWAMAGSYNNVGKYNKDSMSGYITVKWVGYDGNPFATASPDHPNFKPLNTPNSW